MSVPPALEATIVKNVCLVGMVPLASSIVLWVVGKQCAVKILDSVPKAVTMVTQ